MTTAIESVPTPGQLVTVRNRRWVVSDLIRADIASSDPNVFTARPHHLVSLSSIEDDARDEELRVVWELELGAVVHDSTTLPSPSHGFDEPAELDAFLHALRWGAIASADHTALQAPFRSGIQLEDYQLDPVVRALSMPRTNLLIADDVGLGKTIEAGLVMQELALRHRARTMLIVCPAGLTLQWRDEMRDKFGLDFRIVDRDLLKSLRRNRGPYVNPWTHYPRLIVSIDWLKRDRPMKLLRDVLPTVASYPRTLDLLLVDEVHTCAPSGRGRYAVDSQRTRAIRTLAAHCEHRLFLSATPHNGYLESFTALLELLDDQRFARGVQPSEIELDRIMVRRLKADLPARWDGSPRFASRVVDYLNVRYSVDERRAHELLNQYTASRKEGADGRGATVAVEFVTTLLKRRLFSSPKAFAETIETHLATMTDPRRSGSRIDDSESVLQPMRDRLDETAENDEAYADAEREALTVANRCGQPLSSDQRALLDELRQWARAARDRPDAKFEEFLRWLEPIVRPDGQWSRERVIVFSEYRDTQRWLRERLLFAGYPSGRLAQLYGGQDRDEREHTKQIFTEDPDLDDVRILLATDAASEGINLQDHCHRVLHWEIPWNPNRLEQRNGRVDRHGQRADVVEIKHFVPVNWAERNFAAGSLEDEVDFLRIAAEKVERIRSDLGSAGDVIAAQIERKMLGEREDWPAADAEITHRSSRAKLKVDRDLARRLSKLTAALSDSRTELKLTPEAVRQVVQVALWLAHRRELISTEPPENFTAQVFRLPELPGAWAAARNDGLRHPLTGHELPVTFDQEAAAGRKDVVVLHLGHRLVRMCLRLLRAELWAQASTIGGASKLHRVTARVVQGDLLRAPAAVVHGRVVITGNEGTRLHEEIITVGGLVEAGRLVRAKQQDVDGWLAAASDELVAAPVRERLNAVWSALSGPLGAALDHRARQRTNSIAALLHKRCDEEVAAIEAVLAELRRSIEDALAETDRWWQPSLFEEAERVQLRSDHEALAARLATIPEQRERETAALRGRYADPKPHWFPAAVTFLVPAAMHRAEGAH